MNETTFSVIITLAYADATTRNFKFNGVDPAIFQAETTPVQKVKAINTNMPASFKTTFISENGAECTMISKLQSVQTSEEVIYSAS